MSKLVELKSSDGKSSFYIESTDSVTTGGLQQATGYFEKEFDKIIAKINPFCESIIENFKKLEIKPDSASAEFGLCVTGEGNIFVVKASGEASIKITLNWNKI